MSDRQSSADTITIMSTVANDSSQSSSSSPQSPTTATSSSTSTKKTKDMTSPLVILFRLIDARDWEKIDVMFLSGRVGRQLFQHLAARVSNSKSFNGMTILHACVRFNPPSDLVTKMIELCPTSPSGTDCLGRCPLHVATGCGVDSDLIKVLVEAYPEACTIQDSDGRTPLHMSCDLHTELFEESAFEKTQVSHQTIQILLKASLESSIIEDDDGMSAIEYALFSEAKLDTVRLIQKAAQHVRVRKQKADAEERRRSSALSSSETSTTSSASMVFVKAEETKEEWAPNQIAPWAATEHFNPRRSLTMVARSA